MIRKPFWIGLILALSCLLLFAMSTFSGGQVTAASIQATPTSVTSSSRVIGLPAIHPSLAAASSLATPTARFTIADVQAYLQNHPFVGGHIVKGATARIVTTQFMTSSQASALMYGAETGLPTTATVCYAKIQGPFTQESAPIAPGAQQLPTVAYAIEIFDAQTGNLLMWWTPSV